MELWKGAAKAIGLLVFFAVWCIAIGAVTRVVVTLLCFGYGCR